MELTEEDKQLLMIEKFIKRMINDFYIDDISFKSEKGWKFKKVDVHNDKYPLVIKIFESNNIWTISWDDFFSSHSFTGKKLKDKNKKEYTVPEIKEYIKIQFPRFFNRVFYENNFNVSSAIIDKLAEPIHKKLSAIKLNKELENNLIPKQKKFKL